MTKLLGLAVTMMMAVCGCAVAAAPETIDDEHVQDEVSAAKKTSTSKKSPPTPSSPAPTSASPPARASGAVPSDEDLPALPPPPDMPSAPPLDAANQAAIEAAKTGTNAVPVEMTHIDVTKLPSLVGGQFTTARPEVGKFVNRYNTASGAGCTATLIAPNVVLTAAHCTKWENWDVPTTLEGGYFDITAVDGTVTRHYIEAVVSFGTPETLGSTDISLLRLTYDIPANQAQPARLATAYPTAGSATIFGYGCNDRSDQENNPATGHKQMRAISLGDVKLICPGDSGGPTMDPNGDVFRVTSGYAKPRIGGSTLQTISDWIPAWVPIFGWLTSDLFGDVVMYRDNIQQWTDYWAKFSRPLP